MKKVIILLFVMLSVLVIWQLGLSSADVSERSQLLTSREQTPAWEVGKEELAVNQTPALRATARATVYPASPAQMGGGGTVCRADRNGVDMKAEIPPISWGSAGTKAICDSLEVVKWDFEVEWGLYTSGNTVYAKKFLPSCDFLAGNAYEITGAFLLLIDFDPPDSTTPGPIDTLHIWYGDDLPGGWPPSGPNLLHTEPFQCPFFEGDPISAEIVYVPFDPPVPRVDQTDPIWLLFDQDYLPLTDYGSILGFDNAVNWDHDIDDTHGGVHQRFEDTYYWDGVEWAPVDEVNFNPILGDWCNAAMGLIVHDFDADDDLFRDDKINMVLVPVQPHPSDPDSLAPVKGTTQNDSIGVQMLITNNSADPAAGDSVCCFGVEVVIEYMVTPDSGDTVYDVIWLYDMHDDTLCMPNGGGHGITSTLYPLYTVVDDTLGPPFIFDQVGQYCIQSVVWQWNCDTLIYYDESQCYDTLEVCILSIPGPDCFEPNDFPGMAAGPFDCGDTLDGTYCPPESAVGIHVGTDVDWYKLVVPDPDLLIQIDVDAASMEPPSPLNASMSLHQSTSPFSMIVQVDDDPRGGNDPYLRYRLEPGTYLVRVWSQDGSVGPYRLETCCDLALPFCNYADGGEVAPCDTNIVFIADMATDRSDIIEGDTLGIYAVLVGDDACRVMEYSPTTNSIEAEYQLAWYPGGGYPRGLAYDYRPPDTLEILWVGDWTNEALYYFSEDDPENLLGSFDYAYFGLQAGALGIAGLAMDNDNLRLWAITNGDPDVFYVFDVSNRAAPTLLWGPIAVPWMVPHDIFGCPPALGAQPYSGAGLAYDDAENVLYAVNQFWGGVGNEVEKFVDNGDGTVKEGGASSLLNETAFAWGIAHVEGSKGEEVYVNDIVSIYDVVGTPGVFNINKYDCHWYVPFVRSDVQADGDHDLFDAIYLLNWLGGINPEPKCVKAADVQDDGDTDLFDAIYLLNWLGGINPKPKKPCCDIQDSCGADPTPDELSCKSYPPCGHKVADKTAVVGEAKNSRLVLKDGVVTLANAEPILGFAFTIEYDGEPATFVDNAGLVTEDFAFFLGNADEPGVVRVVALRDLDMSDGVKLLPAGEHVVARIPFGRNASARVISSVMAMDEARALNHQVVVKSAVPNEFRLDQNYPNPFNPDTEIRYALPENARVTLEVYNVLGQRVRTLVHQDQKAGHQRVIWDSRNDRGEEVTAGVYFYRMTAGDFVAIRKMVLLK